jgi:hypothetical protein
MAVRLSALRASRRFTHQEDFSTSFCWSMSRPQGHNAAGRIRSIEKSNVLIWIRSRHLPACNIVPQPITLPRAPVTNIWQY